VSKGANKWEKGVKLKYKLLALDLDGTLLDSRGRIPPMHIEALKKAQDAGVILVIATGRYYMQTEWIMKELGFEGILVSNDGAVTLKSDTKEIIHEYSYSIDDVEPFISFCRKNDIHFSVCTAFEYYVELMDNYQYENHKEYEIIHTFHEDVMQLKDRVMKFTVQDEKRKGGWQNIEVPSNLKKKVDGEFFKEIVHLESSKTSGLIKVLELLNIEPSEMIAVGDFYNDLDMLEYAGLGIAMGNAPKDVKERADVVTLSNDENGVYHAIEKYIFSS
jgi:Cof subfamily protein (haloacid dehalogenase superfamily)